MTIILDQSELDTVVLAAVKAADRPVKPKDIWTVLWDNGVSYKPGKTPFPVIVAKALDRMRWMGILKRGDDGRYQVTE